MNKNNHDGGLYERVSPEIMPPMELFERTPMTNRDYWLMTELFVLLHGSDVCEAA